MESSVSVTIPNSAKILLQGFVALKVYIKSRIL
jgi:hypothetical protein